MSIRLFNSASKVNPIGLGLIYSEESENFVNEIVPELLTTVEDSFDIYMPTNMDTEKNTIWSIYALNKADFVMTNIAKTDEEGFKESIRFLSEYVKHPSMKNVYMVVECGTVLENEEFKQTIAVLANDPNNEGLFMPVISMEEAVKVIGEIVKGVSDLSFFSITNENGEELTEESIEECSCEDCGYDKEETIVEE